MMIIDADKSFGYPVLRPIYPEQNPADLDYVNTPFEPSISMEFARADTDSFIFTWEYECNVKSIQKHIESGSVKAMLHLYNRDTWLNKCIDLETDEGEVQLPKSLFSGGVEIRIVFMATQDITIESDMIHSDYGYSSFAVAKNSVIGYSETQTYDVRPNLLKKISSIFVLNKDDSLEDGEFFYDIDGDNVNIFASEDQILKLREFERSERLQDVIVSAIYAPIITDLVKIVLDKAENEDDPDTELLWFRTIRDKLETLPAEKVLRHRPHVTAHHLVKKPLSKLVAN